MPIIIFILVLCVLVLVHEWGHFVVAKKTGMRVDEFGIGFPPRLFSFKRKETIYSINLFPIGGFVKIFGEDAVIGETESNLKDSFTAKSKWAQSAVLLAGVTMNVLFAWLLFSLAFAIGVQTAVDDNTAGPETRLMVTEVLPGTPADRASIPRGAVITSIIGTDGAVPEKLLPSTFSEFVTLQGGVPLTISYLVQKNLFVTTLTPEKGIVSDNPDRVALGVQLAAVDVVRESPSVALIKGFTYTLTSLKDITIGLGGLLRDAFQLKADLSNVAGPVGMVGLVGEASSLGFTSLIMFTAFISLNLAVINLLPFPALDGGRLLFVAIEAVKRSPINPRYVTTLNAIGFLLLMLLMIAITWHDISRLL